MDYLRDDASTLFRLVISLVLAGIIGWQREATNRSAGLRTHMLIGMSATLFISLGDPLVARYATSLHQAHPDALRYDPLRLIEAVVAGISFLGAGTIFVSRGRQRVQGLTTAAGILTTAAMGIAVGLSHYILAVGVTALSLLVLVVVGWIERRSATLKRNQDVQP